MSPNTAYLSPISVVAFLHPVLLGNRSRAGFSLPELAVAVTVLGAGVLGVAALGGGARRLAHVAAVRSAQTAVAVSVLEGASADGQWDLDFTADTAEVVPGLVEIRLTVSGSGPAGPRSWVARRALDGF